MAEPTDHITCQEVVELVTDYFEGTLPATETELLEQHVNFCQGCEWYVEQMQITVDAVGNIGEETMPEEMRQRLLAVFRNWSRS
jgi:anti-sigma factor RsiW